MFLKVKRSIYLIAVADQVFFVKTSGVWKYKTQQILNIIGRLKVSSEGIVYDKYLTESKCEIFWDPSMQNCKHLMGSKCEIYKILLYSSMNISQVNCEIFHDCTI